MASIDTEIKQLENYERFNSPNDQYQGGIVMLHRIEQHRKSNYDNVLSLSRKYTSRDIGGLRCTSANGIVYFLVPASVDVLPGEILEWSEGTEWWMITRVITLGETHLSVQQLVSQGSKKLAADDKDLDDRLPVLRRGVFDRDLPVFISESLGRQAPLGLLMLDLDNFKFINDSFGHVAGDEILSECSAFLANQLQGKGRVYRYGGEEFALLLPECSSIWAGGVAEMLRIRLGQMRIGTKGIRVTVSIGVACVPEHSTNPQELLMQADAALYSAKASGRNCVRVTGESNPTDKTEA